MSTRYYQADSSVTGQRDRLDVKDYGKQLRYDSGIDSGNFCDSLPMQVESNGVTSYSGHGLGRPAPPELMVDVENGDSGINMGDDDDVERDCISTVVAPRQQMQSMDVDISQQPGKSSRIPQRSSPNTAKPPTKRPAPRIPKKTVSAATFAPTPSTSSHDIRTVSAPQRSPSPRSVYSQRYPALSTHTTTTQSTSTRPITNKENRGRGPYSSMPAIRSASPLTCNNYQSLDMDRVPPTHGVSIDIYQLQEYMSFFLPDTKDGDTGFHLSVIHNQPDLLDKLLYIMSKDKKLKPVINEQNRLYQTALHLATHLQQTETMRKLLIAGASLNITDHKGNTPLHIAAKFSTTRPLDELTRYVPIPTLLEVSKVRNNEGLSCIHIAAKNGNIEILRKLAELGVNVNMQDFNSGKTALHLAVENTSLACVQFLLETCEADVNSVTYSGCSPLHVASGRGDIAIVAYLVSMGANPELYTDEGDIALDLAGSEQVHTFLTKAAALLNF